MSDDKTIRAAMKRDSQLQIKKTREFEKVHDLLRSTEYTKEEKYVMLVVECGFGKQRAKEVLCM